MSKLHATITNENGATVSKGGNEYLKIVLKRGNIEVRTMFFGFERDTGEHNWEIFDSLEELRGTCTAQKPYCNKCAGLPTKAWEIDLCEKHYHEQEARYKANCKHETTKSNGLCTDCGFNTLGLTHKELEQKGTKQKDEQCEHITSLTTMGLHLCRKCNQYVDL